MKKLLCFAHLAEAQSFIHHFKLKQNNAPSSLYSNDNHSYLVLITGEGLEKTLFNCTQTLTVFPEIKAVFTMGLCGSLNYQLKKYSIIQPQNIRRVNYISQSEVDIHFSAFENTQFKENVNLISCQQRIFNPTVHDKLIPLGSIIDREAWSCHYSSHSLNLPCTSIKIVSDFADSKEDCLNIRKEATQYSDLLLAYFLTNFSTQEETIKIVKENPFSTLQKDIDFHFTQNLKHKLNTFKSLINLDYLEKIILNLKSQKLSPKLRAQLCIQMLVKEYNPQKYQLEKNINNIKNRLDSSSVKIDFIKPENSIQFSLKTKNCLKSEADLKSFKESIEQLNWDNINSTFLRKECNV